MGQSATRPGSAPGGGRFSCFIIGETTLSIRCAELLLARGHLILGLITDNADALRWAGQHAIRAFDPDAGFAATLVGTEYDYLFSIVNERLLPPPVLASARRLAINYHDAPLPRYAGMHSTSWAIMAGETAHGVTWHVASEKVDAGAIIRQQGVPIDPEETALSLNAKCYDAAVESFVSEPLSNPFRGLYWPSARIRPTPASAPQPRTSRRRTHRRAIAARMSGARPTYRYDSQWVHRPHCRLPGPRKMNGNPSTLFT